MELEGPHALIQGATCKLEGSILTSPSPCTDPWVPLRVGYSPQGTASSAPGWQCLTVSSRQQTPQG